MPSSCHLHVGAQLSATAGHRRWAPHHCPQERRLRSRSLSRSKSAPRWRCSQNIPFLAPKNEGTEPCSYLFSCVIERCPSLWSPFIYRENAIENTNLIICSCENALLTIERSCLDVATMEVHPLVVAGGVDSTAEGRRKANICWSLRDPHMVWGY